MCQGEWTLNTHNSDPWRPAPKPCLYAITIRKHPVSYNVVKLRFTTIYNSCSKKRKHAYWNLRPITDIQQFWPKSYYVHALSCNKDFSAAGLSKLVYRTNERWHCYFEKQGEYCKSSLVVTSVRLICDFFIVVSPETYIHTYIKALLKRWQNASI